MERKARPVTIYEIRIERVELPEIELTVSCSKGTYIRTLCHDIGQKFGCGAAMKSLLRLQAAGFVLDEAHTLDEIQSYKAAGSLAEVITPVEQVFFVYPVLTAKPVFDVMLKTEIKWHRSSLLSILYRRTAGLCVSVCRTEDLQQCMNIRKHLVCTVLQKCF